MATQSTLLQIIQFIALITPALAILIEILINFHGGLRDLTEKRNFPFEIQVLFLGFAFILLGGTIIGGQLVLTFDNRLTQSALILIFGALPFLALTILVMNIRISSFADESTTLSNKLVLGMKYGSSIALPAILTVLLYFGPLVYMKDFINVNVDWSYFSNNIEPVWYFYVSSGILGYKSMYALWSHDVIPSTNIGKILNPWFLASFTIGTMYLLIGITPFVGYYVFIYIGVPFVTKTSLLSILPFVWGGIITIALVFTDIDPYNDD